MLEFKPIEIEDKDWIQPLLDYSQYRYQEYSFTFTYLWRDIFAYSIARLNDYVIIKSSREGHPVSYLFPAGRGAITPVLKALEEDAKRHGDNLIFHTVPKEALDILGEHYQCRCKYIALEDYFDYIYESEKLISLAGKKLSSKRNHINRFKENYPDWTYEPITEDNFAEIIEMNKEWVSQEIGQDQTASFSQEIHAVDNAIHDYFRLGLKGGLIRAEGKVVAFSIGDRLTDDTILVHIEKAYKDIQGAYPMINQQFAAHEAVNYKYIDREDDSGHENLRKAKHSYYPVFMAEKYGAKIV